MPLVSLPASRHLRFDQFPWYFNSRRLTMNSTSTCVQTTWKKKKTKKKIKHRRRGRQNICRVWKGSEGFSRLSLLLRILFFFLSSFLYLLTFSRRLPSLVILSHYILFSSTLLSPSACYQTLVCALITPRSSFLLRFSRLTTISSIASHEKNPGTRREAAFPPDQCRAFSIEPRHNGRPG